VTSAPASTEASATATAGGTPHAGTGAAFDDCDGVATFALARIEALLASLEGALDDDETLDSLLLRLVSEQPLAAELEPLLALGPGRPFAGLGGDDVQQAYVDLGCDVEGEYAALDAWLVGRYGGAFPTLATGGRDVLVDDVLPAIEAAGEALVV